MNTRGSLLFAAASLRGLSYPRYYRDFLKEYEAGVSSDGIRERLVKLLTHCREAVPYYSGVMREIGESALLEREPERYLTRLPILTKEALRTRFDELKSSDLERRKWFVTTSGGSTGEPVRLIQDAEFLDRGTAISLLFSHLAGHNLGDSVALLWGSEKDLFEGSIGWRARLYNWRMNTTPMNAFRMDPDRMRAFIRTLNRKRPRLILAYAEAIYELARFAVAEGLDVIPPGAIMTSAGPLYPFMRESIASVFQCPVFNRYGTREVSAIACELPGREGMWVAPWGNYLEIVDDDGHPVPAGVEGNILVTCLNNYAMPLLRYKIGDRGILRPGGDASVGGQWLQEVVGRISDNFTTRGGKVVPGAYFIHLLGVVLNRGHIKKFQVVQEAVDRVTVKIVRDEKSDARLDTAEIIDKVRLVMNHECSVKVDLVDDIPPAASGKHRYTISEVCSETGYRRGRAAPLAVGRIGAERLREESEV